MLFSEKEFADAGVGAVAFIRQLEASRLAAVYPQYRQVHGLPSDRVVFVIHET
jgi:hypothetical protein